MAGALCLLTAAVRPGYADTLNDPLHLFATCAGRMSAEVEFGWMVKTDESAVVEQTRASFDDLIEAIRDAENAPRILNIRIEAKEAHSALLTRGHFSYDERESRMALQMAARNRGLCSSVLTG